MRILRFQFWTSAKQQAKILNPTNSGFKKNIQIVQFCNGFIVIYNIFNLALINLNLLLREALCILYELGNVTTLRSSPRNPVSVCLPDAICSLLPPAPLLPPAGRTEEAAPRCSLCFLPRIFSSSPKCKANPGVYYEERSENKILVCCSCNFTLFTFPSPLPNVH